MSINTNTFTTETLEKILWKRGRERHVSKHKSINVEHFWPTASLPDLAYRLCYEQVVTDCGIAQALILRVRNAGPWGKRAQQLLTLAYPMVRIREKIPPNLSSFATLDHIVAPICFEEEFYLQRDTLIKEEKDILSKKSESPFSIEYILYFDGGYVIEDLN